MGVDQLGEKNLPCGADGAVGLAEDFPGAGAGEHLISVGRGAGKLGLVELLKGVSAPVWWSRWRWKAGKRPRIATHDVIAHVGRRTGGLVRDIRQPVKRPLWPQV